MDVAYGCPFQVHFFVEISPTDLERDHSSLLPPLASLNVSRGGGGGREKDGDGRKAGLPRSALLIQSSYRAVDVSKKAESCLSFIGDLTCLTHDIIP